MLDERQTKHKNKDTSLNLTKKNVSAETIQKYIESQSKK